MYHSYLIANTLIYNQLIFSTATFQSSGIGTDISRLKQEVDDLQRRKHLDQQKALQIITQLQVNGYSDGCGIVVAILVIVLVPEAVTIIADNIA